MSETSTHIPCTAKITRAELASVPTPPATHPCADPSPCGGRGLAEALGRRHIGVVGEEFAVSKDGLEMFGVIDLETASMDADSRSESGMLTTSASGCPALSACAYSCVTTSRFRGTIVPSWRNIPRTFRLKTAYRLALTECSVTSNRCGDR
jgi:hypothetical protein